MPYQQLRYKLNKNIIILHYKTSHFGDISRFVIQEMEKKKVFQTQGPGKKIERRENYDEVVIQLVYY